jgi:hypothetical protein
LGIFQGQGRNELFAFHNVRISLHDDFENLAFHAQADAFSAAQARAPTVGARGQGQCD